MAHFHPLVTIMSQLEPNGKLRKSQNVTKVPQFAWISQVVPVSFDDSFQQDPDSNIGICSGSSACDSPVCTPAVRIATNVSQVEQKGRKGVI
jgi:hypothetical protein